MEASSSGSGERHWDDDGQGKEEDATRAGGAGRGGGQDHQQQQQQQQQRPPPIDAFDLPSGRSKPSFGADFPSGLIPELVNAARTAGCRPHAPIRAEDAEAAARVAEAAEEEPVIVTPYLSARLAALEAELAAYVPGMTRADLEEKLARARGEATRGSGWEAVMRRGAAEAAAAAAGGLGGGGGTGGGGGGEEAAAGATAGPGDDGRFEGPRWLDRAGVGFEYRGGKKKGSAAAGAAAAGAAAVGAAAANAATHDDPLDSDLASFREHQSRAYHEDGRSQRRGQRR